MKIIVLTILICFLSVHISQAQWSTDPTVNNAICAAAGDQFLPTIVSDGAGGAIITWYDLRGGISDIYAQRINSSGAVQWTANGVALCTAAGHQRFPTIVSDGAGGAIITWEDSRNGSLNIDIYAQRINSSGTVQWIANGVAICTATRNQYSPTIVSDGASGAIITWNDARSVGGYHDIYAQQINSSGGVQWTANGVAICTASGYQDYPTIVSDGSGGAIITWYDERSGVYIYAQRINSSGAVLWTGDGVAISTAVMTGNQFYPPIVSDGAGGAIITWADIRSSNSDIYAQRINSSGAVQWAGDGIAICTAVGDQRFPTIVSEGLAGAIITWYDYRGSISPDIYAQQINASGQLGVVTSVEIFSSAAPQEFHLDQNYPNPFNPTCTINYSLTKEGIVKLTVYNTIGSKVATIINENKPAGNYSVQFNGNNLASGIYICQLKANDFVSSKKMLLLK